MTEHPFSPALQHDYTNFALLGQGGFGTVYRATRTATQEVVAIKCIALDKGGALDVLTRREAQLLAKMRHPNVVAFKEGIFQDTRCYLVMEYCPAGDLHDRMQELRAVG